MSIFKKLNAASGTIDAVTDVFNSANRCLLAGGELFSTVGSGLSRVMELCGCLGDWLQAKNVGYSAQDAAKWLPILMISPDTINWGKGGWADLYADGYVTNPYVKDTVPKALYDLLVSTSVILEDRKTVFWSTLFHAAGITLSSEEYLGYRAMSSYWSLDYFNNILLKPDSAPLTIRNGLGTLVTGAANSWSGASVPYFAFVGGNEKFFSSDPVSANEMLRRWKVRPDWNPWGHEGVTGSFYSALQLGPKFFADNGKLLKALIAKVGQLEDFLDKASASMGYSVLLHKLWASDFTITLWATLLNVSVETLRTRVPANVWNLTTNNTTIVVDDPNKKGVNPDPVEDPQDNNKKLVDPNTTKIIVPGPDVTDPNGEPITITKDEITTDVTVKVDPVSSHSGLLAMLKDIITLGLSQFAELDSMVSESGDTSDSYWERLPGSLGLSDFVPDNTSAIGLGRSVRDVLNSFWSIALDNLRPSGAFNARANPPLIASRLLDETDEVHEQVGLLFASLSTSVKFVSPRLTKALSNAAAIVAHDLIKNRNLPGARFFATGSSSIRSFIMGLFRA